MIPTPAGKDGSTTVATLAVGLIIFLRFAAAASAAAISCCCSCRRLSSTEIPRCLPAFTASAGEASCRTARRRTLRQRIRRARQRCRHHALTPKPRGMRGTSLSLLSVSMPTTQTRAAQVSTRDLFSEANTAPFCSIAQTVAHLLILRLTFYIPTHSSLFFASFTFASATLLFEGR